MSRAIASPAAVHEPGSIVPSPQVRHRAMRSYSRDLQNVYVNSHFLLCARLSAQHWQRPTLFRVHARVSVPAAPHEQYYRGLFPNVEDVPAVHRFVLPSYEAPQHASKVATCRERGQPRLKMIGYAMPRCGCGECEDSVSTLQVLAVCAHSPLLRWRGRFLFLQDSTAVTPSHLSF
jgi:hypothetical protein